MSIARVERRLAAILATDIVGYSRLIEADEARTLAAIKDVRVGILEPLFREHKGRVVKLMGDGSIVEFASVVDAVVCAAAVQREVTIAQQNIPPECRITFRIGISLGDVVVEGDDLLGDGVNIAARLEALAEPGGICITDSVRAQLAGKTEQAFVDTGERRLKNIAQPVRVWRWAEAPQSPEHDFSLPLPDRPSLAVLPFDNPGGRPDETYFSDGITQDIITGLARFRSLFVIARDSSFTFRGKTISVADIGRRLGVSYLLEGSVRRAGERVRISAQLIEAATGVHVWAERYDRRLDDIFAIQDEVAQMIVSALVGRIEAAGLQKSARVPTTSLGAYDCVLRGLAHFRGYADDDNQKAYEMFERAVAIDPRYALAHAYLALVRVALHGHAAAPSDVLEQALARATRALELDPQESRCHRVLGLIRLYCRDYDAAEYHTRRAVELNPNDADRKMGMGNLLTMRGRPEEGLGWIEQAIRLNPSHPAWYNIVLSITLYSLRRYAEAAQALSLRPNPGYWSRARKAACYAHLDRMTEAQAEAATILRLKPDFSTEEFLRRDVLLERSADREHLREGLLKAGLPA